MKINILKPRKALNKAYLKVKPNRTDIERFKIHLIQLLDRMNDVESEEFHKNLVIDFLQKTYYEPKHFINTKGRNDLVIHHENNAKSDVGVIIEAKKPTNKSEMITTEKLNTKAFQELVLYYLRERITHKNLKIQNLVITNINEWFIFKVTTFERLFAQNKNLVQQFIDFESGRLADTKTDFFYKQIAEPFIAEIKTEIEFTYFNIQDYQKPLRNDDKEDDKQLIGLFKLLSPEHLLNYPFVNDSNSLDKRFYTELLHIIGLTEIKEGGKKLIERNKENQRNSGSIIEDTIIQLDSLDKINRLEKPSQFGANYQERLFNIALELSITWLNRILFLKLLEAQIISYHKGDKSYGFLSLDKIKNYDDLNSLFFQVLAKKSADRNSDVKLLFDKVPYLNSSLFEPTEIEHTTLLISNLKDDKVIPIISTTVLKNDLGKKRTGEITTLEYLMEFLSAYDFSSEGSEEIQEESKTLISASVLGLIFEKINGYKDGSFFTPGFITMYMCRETIRKAVVQKFNETKKWKCENLDEIYDLIEDRKEANDIVNSIKICDPAVGSGHFLVSALNEIITVKNDLKILQDRNGKRLKEYQVEVFNDELVITDEEGELFDYKPTNKESQRIQETLFHEKQTIIENCLFGVDINPNSVKICRLRLWIELLKNAYYKNATELETLPNIDINIKCGNSLVSRFALDADLKQALKKSKWTIDSYKLAVDTYRNAKNKEEKREMERLILEIKQSFSSEIRKNDPIKNRLDKLASELYHRFTGTFLFEPQAPYGENGKNIEKKRKAEKEKLEKEIEELSTKVEEIKANKIYENSFEWRFEFPEVLNDDGDFIGFDVVIGNPPYGVEFNSDVKTYIKQNFKSYQYKFESYIYFIEKGLELLKAHGHLDYITPTLWLSLENNYLLRSIIINQNDLKRIFIHGENVFEEAIVNTCSFLVAKSLPNENFYLRRGEELNKLSKLHWVNKDSLEIEYRLSPITKVIIEKIRTNSDKLIKYGDVIQGITPYDSYRGQSKEIIKNRAYHFDYKKDESCGKWLEGKNLSRYSVNWSNTWLSYGNWLAAPREKRFFEGKRILFREVPGKGKQIQACIVDDEFYYGHSISPFKPFNDMERNTEYILGIVNSKLISWYCKYTLANFGKDIFPKLNPNDIKELPISKELKEFDMISELTKKILLIRQNSITDTSELEAQIDQLVYQLYDLTEEEIAIVENSSK